MSELTSVLSGIRDAMRHCADLSISEHAHELGLVHQIDLDINAWSEHLTSADAQHLRRVRRDLAHAEHAAASGLYNQAFASLRLFLENGFAAVYFSAHEYERRRWMSDRADFSWSKALDTDHGVLSKSFICEFAAPLASVSPNYAAKAATTYRYCSQFVHGKAKASWSTPDDITYDANILESWCDHALAAGEAVLFALTARFGETLNSDEVIETIRARFSTHAEIREMIGHATDA